MALHRRRVLALEVQYRSHSQISTWLKCGEAYRLQKVLKAPEYPAAWLAGGTAFHSAIETWERFDRQPSLRDIAADFVREYDELIAIEREKWPDLSVWGKAGRYKPEVYIESLRDKGPIWVMDYMDYAHESDWKIWGLPDGSPAVEVPFYLQLSETVHIRGYVDQVIVYPDGTISVRDLKTGTKKPKDELQLGVYARAIEDLFDVKVTAADYYMAKEGKARAALSLARYTPEYLLSIFGNLNTAVENGIYIPNPSEDTCRPCGVQRFCWTGGGNDDTYWD